MTREKIVEKIMKLRALSEKAGTEHEAAAAAAMATRMMLENRIAEAELDDEGEGESGLVEEFVDERQCGVGGYTQRMPRWRVDLLNGVARSLSCRTIYMKTSMKVFGPKDAVQTVLYLYKYLWREIFRLAAEAIEREENGYVGSRAWGNSFRHGASVTVCARLRQERANVIEEVEERGKRDGSSCTALVLVSDEKRSEEFMKERHPNLRKMGRPSLSSADGFSRGVEAGRKVNLRSGPALKQPSKQIDR